MLRTGLYPIERNGGLAGAPRPIGAGASSRRGHLFFMQDRAAFPRMIGFLAGEPRAAGS